MVEFERAAGFLEAFPWAHSQCLGYQFLFITAAELDEKRFVLLLVIALPEQCGEEGDAV